jgi:predicted nucleic acid-binding protein
MTDRVFVDTNVLIYAHDRDAGGKHDQAVHELDVLWESRNGVVSLQVLQEFYVNVTRKIPHPLDPEVAAQVVEDFAPWEGPALRAADVVAASRIATAHRLSFWDALIVRAAMRCHATRILSEDLNAGPVIEGIEIVNPFAVSDPPPRSPRSRRP